MQTFQNKSPGVFQADLKSHIMHIFIFLGVFVTKKLHLPFNSVASLCAACYRNKMLMT